MVANGFEGVPWFIGGGAKVSRRVARVLAYSAFGGNEGVAGPNDLKVVATAGTADMNVHIGTGAFGVLNRSTGVQNEAYAGRATQVSDLLIPPTGTGARSDLIVARIEDPEFPPWSAYDPVNQADMVANGPYAFPRRISGVASNVISAAQLGLNQSMIALARLDIPAGTTGAITPDMIKDLRQLIAPKTVEFNQVQSTPPNTNPNYLLVTDTNWTNWPTNSFRVTVPVWATHALIEVWLNQVQIDGGGNFNGRINIGGLTGDSPNFDYNPPVGNADGTVVGVPYTAIADIDVHTLQGQTVDVRFQAQRTFINASNTTHIWMGGGTSPHQQVVFKVKFRQLPL